MVDILLWTYNGERFLGEQLDSILSQDFSHWRLIIRDDGSSDATSEILKSYLHHSNIILLEDSTGNLGVKRSFEKLLRTSTANYIMFCDQDDVWLPHKINTMLSLIKKEEITKRPILVVSDLIVIDEENSIIADSFWKHQRLSPFSGSSFRSMVIQNKFPGCSMLFNRDLKNLSLTIPEEAILHDWWLALVASAFGKICVIDSPLMRYRQHETNTLGIPDEHLFRSIYRVFTGNPETLKNLTELSDLPERQQCVVFRRKYADFLSPEQKKILESFSVFSLFNILRYRMFRQPWISHINYLLVIVYLKVKNMWSTRHGCG